MITGQKVTKATAGGVSFQVLGPNPRRVGVIISSTSTGNAWFAFGETPGTDDGLKFQSGTMAPFLLLFDSPNDWITLPLNCFGSAALTISVVELIDRPA